MRRRTPRRSTEEAIAARDRLEQREVRSYEVEHVLQLMHLDFHHGSRKVLTRRGDRVDRGHRRSPEYVDALGEIERDRIEGERGRPKPAGHEDLVPMQRQQLQ